MSRESQFYDRIVADATIMAILTGGCWKSESVGIEGITRETAGAAFDSNGYLRPACLVKQRGRVPDNIIIDPITQVSSTSQIIECWLYCDAASGYTAIDAAIARLYVLFQGYKFSDSLEIFYVNLLDRQRDKGSLAGASMAKIDFQVKSIWQP